MKSVSSSEKYLRQSCSKIEQSTDESAKAKLYLSNKFTERAHSDYRFTYAYK